MWAFDDDVAILRMWAFEAIITVAATVPVSAVSTTWRMWAFADALDVRIFLNF